MKKYLSDTHGIPIENQRIIFAGRQLEDDKSMSRSRLSPESTVHLVLRNEIRLKPTVQNPPTIIQETKRTGFRCIIM